MVRHFAVGRNTLARPWDPANPAPELPRECVYFGKVLAEMERHLPEDAQDLHCYLTFDQDALPEYGPHVVAVLIGEEWGLIPRYARHVRLAARVVGRYPYLGIRKWYPLSRLKMLLAVKHGRNWLRHLRSQWRRTFPPSEWPAPVHKRDRIVHLPWGSASLVDVPIKPMSERTRNYFFSGGIADGADFGYRKYISTPKVLARQALIAAVSAMEKRHPELASAETLKIHGQAAGPLPDMSVYARRLMDTKVCLAPRGTVVDTLRLFEGLKSGCAVICDRLPDEWYYRGAPVIQLDSWDELEAVLLPLLADPARLEQMHTASLRFWEEVCGEKAVGRYLASAIEESRMN